MKREARVTITLDLGDDAETWVTAVPVSRAYPNRTSGVALAAGQAAAMFIENVMRQAETVAERLADLDRA